MNRGDGSFTARLVCLARGLAGVDPYAGPMLGGWAARLLALPGPPRRLAGPLTAGLAATVGGRTRAFDAAILDAFGAGARQLVLLGAGFDARPWRLAPILGDHPVYCVDHPATAAARAASSSALPPRADVRVDVDFATDPFDTRLLAAGFDPTRVTMVVWEGVSMYLPEAAVRDTLGRLGSLLAPGSRLVFDVWCRDHGPAAALEAIGRVGLRRLGEPLDFTCTEAEIPALLAGAGFRLLGLETAVQAAKPFGGLGWPGLCFVSAEIA